MAESRALPIEAKVNERVEVDVIRGPAPAFADIAKDLNNLLKEHSAYSHIRAAVRWDREKQCSVCHRRWEPMDLEYDGDPAGTIRCAACGALISKPLDEKGDAT